ncbi:uncharacterized protein BX663DRAFT_529546 [Cokeromyces recurvatus]|uniref:uncharacterized protein n=1 Tax=Cokeromyces recurvatus TaxID=90255 RepID=UPI002220334D|nr:uncharacterized protein BX663DRAFT_529546 [Cokeromyces recurvatus]KAI7906108.1 hypothetical protein BX663DRAFT_529546 [Cokeromyces recurvatus]
MSWWGQNPFDEIVEKATSELLPGGQEDIVLNLEISDQIRSKKVNAKDAMRSIKKRLGHKNPNVQLATISLVDTCVKNGGELFVREVASREFMDELVSILKAPTGCNLDVKNKILNVIQIWGLASKNKPSLSYMYDTYALLKAEGMQFPPVNENIDGILLETSSHHCRNCGGTFCQQCSSKTMPLPKLGINESVRVCDGCYIKLKLDKATLNKPISSAPETTKQTTSNEDDLDEDMKKAIELSLKEAEQQKNNYSAGYVSNNQTNNRHESSIEDDPDLAAAIAASLRDLEISKQQQKEVVSQDSAVVQQIHQNDLSPIEMENILLFSTLMDRVYATGEDISNDPQINQLYTQIGTLQPKLVQSLNETIHKRNSFIELHEKLNRVVRSYDRLLEERIAGISQGSSYNIPEQHYQPQTLYHQPQQNYNYMTSSEHDTNKYYPPPTVNNQDINQYYYSAPPHYQVASPTQSNTEQKKPVEEAPLIDL